MSRAADERGVVLLLVLAILVLAISSVYAFARSSLLEIAAARHRVDLVRATLLARSGVAIGVRAISDDLLISDDGIGETLETRRDPWYALGSSEIVVPPSGSLRIVVRDLGDRVNLNALVDVQGEQIPAARNFLAQALERIIRDMPGRDEDKPYDADELADAILDWIDTDKRTRLGSREHERYGQAWPNRRALSLADFWLIPNLGLELLGAMSQYFTIFPPRADIATAGVNPNTAPAHVLGLIYTGVAGSFRGLLDERDVYQILRTREEGRIFCPTNLREGCVTLEDETGRVGSSFPPLTFRNNLFTIRSFARFADAHACIETIIDRSDRNNLKAIAYQFGCSL
jgi:type II secretory pathway component PulK